MTTTRVLEWDAFISHATEDKDRFVRRLAHALTILGARVWYDEFSLRLGDDLSASIDYGLANSRFGIVLVSPAFIKKPWPKRELRNAEGHYLVHLDAFVVDAMRGLRRRGESYSDVILRLAAKD